MMLQRLVFRKIELLVGWMLQSRVCSYNNYLVCTCDILTMLCSTLEQVPNQPERQDASFHFESHSFRQHYHEAGTPPQQPTDNELSVALSGQGNGASPSRSVHDFDTSNHTQVSFHPTELIQSADQAGTPIERESEGLFLNHRCSFNRHNFVGSNNV
jgi:hypothetical protein